MKKILYILSILTFIIISLNINAQQGILLSDEELLSEDSEFAIGIHTGIFDCNQTVKYPYNIGILAQYNYIPNIAKNWYFGGEVGAFFTSSPADEYGRKTQVFLTDITVYPGMSFPIGVKISPDDNVTTKLKKLRNARKFKIGLGFTVVLPLQKRSSGSRVNNEAIKPSIGFSLRTSYDLPNRLTLFANATRVGSDLDGYSLVNTTRLEPSSDNENSTTYYYKLGILWNFLGE